MPFWAVLDACVLYPMRLADALLWIADEELYQPLWTAQILDEVARNVKHDYPNADIASRIRRMTQYFPEAMVENYSQLEPSMTNHEKDRHVLAAAVVGRAQVIVTNDKRDFPDTACAPYGIEAQSSDEFLSNCFGLSPERTILALLRQADAKRRPPLSLEELLDLLIVFAGGFVDEVKDYLAQQEARSPEFLNRLRERMW